MQTTGMKIYDDLATSCVCFSSQFYPNMGVNKKYIDKNPISFYMINDQKITPSGFTDTELWFILTIGCRNKGVKGHR